MRLCGCTTERERDDRVGVSPAVEATMHDDPADAEITDLDRVCARARARPNGRYCAAKLWSSPAIASGTSNMGK